MIVQDQAGRTKSGVLAEARLNRIGLSKEWDESSGNAGGKRRQKTGARSIREGHGPACAAGRWRGDVAGSCCEEPAASTTRAVA